MSAPPGARNLARHWFTPETSSVTEMEMLTAASASVVDKLVGEITTDVITGGCVSGVPTCNRLGTGSPIA